MIGVASCSRLDIMALFGPVFGRVAPEIALHPPGAVDPETVEFVLTFGPADDTFRPYPNLRAIFSVGAGTDAIDACPSRPEGVPVFRVEEPDQAQQMAGFAAFHVLWHHRGMGDYVAYQSEARWQRNLGGFTPRARRIGVLGMGHMGRGIATGLVALGYPVAGYSRRPPGDPLPGVSYFDGDGLDAFLARTDILINVLPLTSETTGLIDAAFLAKLPQGAALIHLGRGGQVVEDDLLQAIEAGHLSGASVDVFETEPLPREHPFWSHPRILVTPHVASIPEPEDVARSVRDRLSSLDTASLKDPAQ